MSDPFVTELQERLVAAGYPLVVDGLYGPKTRAALARAIRAPEMTPEPTEPTEPEDREMRLLMAELRADEGFVPHAYKDSLGYLTIGIGRLIDKARGGGITIEEAEFLKRNDVARVRAGLDARIPWWRRLDPVRQRALQNMAFQLGVDGLAKFTRSLALIQAGAYEEAARALRLSKWAGQTPERAARVIRMIETGRAQHGVSA